MHFLTIKYFLLSMLLSIVFKAFILEILKGSFYVIHGTHQIMFYERNYLDNSGGKKCHESAKSSGLKYGLIMNPYRYRDAIP